MASIKSDEILKKTLADKTSVFFFFLEIQWDLLAADSRRSIYIYISINALFYTNKIYSKNLEGKWFVKYEPNFIIRRKV